jgi:hypothetical protein
MDLSQSSSKELEDLAVSLFEDLTKRQLRIKVLARMSNDVLKNLGFSILEIIATRMLESSEDQRLWEQAFIKYVQGTMPELLLAYQQKHQLIQLGQILLQKVVPLIREGQSPKAGRNEIVHNHLTELETPKADVYKHMLAQLRKIFAFVPRTFGPI